MYTPKVQDVVFCTDPRQRFIQSLQQLKNTPSIAEISFQMEQYIFG